MNNQLEKQIVLLRDKLEQMKIPSREGIALNQTKPVARKLKICL